MLCDHHVTENFVLCKIKLWVSSTNGSSWTNIGQNVTRYAWRQLNSTYEEGSAVYFDQKSNCQLIKYIIVGFTLVYFYVATACYLFKATASNYNNPTNITSLGAFMPYSFALSHQYMFVQVRTHT